VIAEIGLNHHGSLEMAKKLIYEAKQCGCEIVKLQTFSSEKRVSAIAKGAKYTDKTLQMEETMHEMFKRFELSHNDHVALFKYAEELGIPIISTPFDERSADLLCELGVKAFKVASADIVNLSFLKYLAAKKRPILLSTGMSSLAEVEEALDVIASEDNPNVILLHCASAYPADPMDVNLRAIKTMRQAFRIPVGFSDHTIGPLVSVIAMTLGAHVIERHFTLDRKFEGPDHILSSEPEEMRQLVTDRNIVFSALGTGIKKPSAAEYNTINRHRKSIFTTDHIKKGSALTLDNLTIKGPGHGLMPKYLKLILGKKVSRDIEADHPLTWDDLLTD
jgi:sialic acid synthase SpsE